MKDLFPQGVFLSTSESHLLLCIRQGLELLEINCADNLYDSDLNIIDISYLSYCKPSFLVDLLPQLYDEYQGTIDKTLFLSIADEATFNYISDKDYWFLTPHILDDFEIKGTRIPWAFGFKQQLIELYQNHHQNQREYKIIRNFTNSMNQSIRESLDFILIPKLESKIVIDRRKQDYKEYLFNLLNSRFCFAYGGKYDSDLTKNTWIMENQWKGIDMPYIYKKNTVMQRWDSWRLWESWALGCIPIHLDFEKYGLRLPVMPTNWKHYIGLDLANLEQDVEKILSLSEYELEEISENGRNWAWEHYSPIAVTERILSIGADKVISSL